MIPNLIVLDPEHLLENGNPNPQGIIFASAVIIHPDFKTKTQTALMQMFDEGSSPIFVSMKEAKKMMHFTKMIKTSKGPTRKFIENEYTQWWGEIQKRALEEANEYQCSLKESEGKETPAISL